MRKLNPKRMELNCDARMADESNRRVGETRAGRRQGGNLSRERASERAKPLTLHTRTGREGDLSIPPASSQNIDRTKKATCLTFHQRRSQRDTTMSRGIILAQNKNRTLPKQSRPKERLRPSSSPPYPERPIGTGENNTMTN